MFVTLTIFRATPGCVTRPRPGKRYSPSLAACQPLSLRTTPPVFFRGDSHFDQSAEPSEVGVDLDQVQYSPVIDRRFNRHRQAQPAQVTRCAQRVGILLVARACLPGFTAA